MKKILVVEDDEKFGKLLVDEFEKQGFKTAYAPNGEEGLKMAMEFKPDSILSDLMMPVMDGLEMIKNLKEQDWSKDIPVTVLTNSDQVVTVADALDKGVFKYIIKSDLSIEDIVKRVGKEMV